MEKYEIKLVQKPVIQHQLAEVGKSVTSRIDELNIGKLVATGDTIQALKQLRADLNKELKDYEDQRKSIKTAVTNPYSDFETLYKAEVSEKYKSAIDTLKDKIAEFENKVKAEKKANIERYFSELIVAEKVDFLKFSDTGIDINLSTSEKKYKETCDAFVQRVQDDVILINSMEYRAEMMAEYKANGLNASAAIKTVNDRKEAEKLEKERIQQRETDRRQNMLRNINFVSHDMTKTFNLVNDESVFITYEDIKTLSPEEWNERFVELEAEYNKLKSPPPESSDSSEEQKAGSGDLFNQNSTGAAVATAPKVAKPVSAPNEVKPEKKLKAAFEAYGTFAQLKSVGQFMKDNGIEYKNL